MTPDNTASQVVTPIKDDILHGVFSPGEKLKMTHLKARYGVGVGPLREALSQLVVEQLVIVENQRGFRVHPISLEELLDIYETRAHIESLCVHQAIERGDDEWEAGIVAAAHRLKKAGTLTGKSTEALQEWERQHHAFHTAIASGCRSASLLGVRRSLYEKASRYRNLWLAHNMPNNSVFDANQKEHEALVSALLKRTTKAATELVHNHILEPSRILQNEFEDFL